MIKLILVIVMLMSTALGCGSVPKKKYPNNPSSFNQDRKAP